VAVIAAWFAILFTGRTGERGGRLVTEPATDVGPSWSRAQVAARTSSPNVWMPWIT
jgi:hypothetical protein